MGFFWARKQNAGITSSFFYSTFDSLHVTMLAPGLAQEPQSPFIMNTSSFGLACIAHIVPGSNSDHIYITFTFNICMFIHYDADKLGPYLHISCSPASTIQCRNVPFELFTLSLLAHAVLVIQFWLPFHNLFHHFNVIFLVIISSLVFN